MKALTKMMIFSILPAFLVACSLPGVGNTIPAGGTGGTPAAMGGNCTNPLFPVVYRAVWDYQAENPVIGDYSFSYEIGPVGADGFLLTVEYSTGVAADLEWTCDAGDLIQLEAGNGPAGVMASLGGTWGFTETGNHFGVTLPANVSAGDTWLQSMDLGGQVHLPNNTIGSAEGTYSASYSATGMEEVSVPAGTFDAMRIEVQALYDLVVTVEGMDVPMPFPTSMTLWYAPGVGLVKAENMNEITTYEIIELWRYSIP
jgi:hypothetical protein